MKACLQINNSSVPEKINLLQHETVRTTTTTQSHLDTLLSVQELISWGDAMQMYPPSRDIWWSSAVLHQVSLTFTVMHKVGLTFLGDAIEKIQMSSPVEASGSQEEYYISSALHLFAHFMFSCCRGKSYIGIWIADMSSWTLSNLCRLFFVVVVVSWCCCSSCVIVDPQLQMNKKNNKNNKITQ